MNSIGVGAVRWSTDSQSLCQDVVRGSNGYMELPAVDGSNVSHHGIRSAHQL